MDIYDINTQTWSTAELSMARYAMAAVAAGNKIFFGGGEISDGTEPVNTVDIYDVSTNTWSVTALSAAGNSIAATTTGNKVFFAGGDLGYSGVSGYDHSHKVDIYDLVTGTWSTASLSEGKSGLSAVATNNKVYFAGGSTRINNSSNNFAGVSSILIDIYDNVTNTWTTSFLQEGKSSFAGIAVGDKIYWAGGNTSRITGSSSTGVPNFSSYTSCVVEIRDLSTGSVTIQNLFKPTYFLTSGCQNAVIKNNQIIFYGFNGSDSDKFDIYDIATNTWSIGLLPMNIVGACILSVNNIIYIAGGNVNGVLSNQVYKLEF